MTKDEALKMAIEVMERIDGWLDERRLGNLTPIEKETIVACKEALEQPTQEPVAYCWIDKDGAIWEIEAKKYTEEKLSLDYVPLYTHPKEWQGLSEEEINSLIKEHTVTSVKLGGAATFWTAIEQKLKEKNK